MLRACTTVAQVVMVLMKKASVLSNDQWDGFETWRQLKRIGLERLAAPLRESPPVVHVDICQRGPKGSKRDLHEALPRDGCLSKPADLGCKTVQDKAHTIVCSLFSSLSSVLIPPYSAPLYSYRHLGPG